MNKLIRALSLALLAALLVGPRTANTVSASSASGGPLVLMGIDAEDGGVGAHGSISVYQTIVRDILAKANNGGSNILVIGGGKGGDVTAFWNAIDAGTAHSVSYVNGANIASRSFSGFRMIAVVSDARNTPSGGLTQTENNYLAGRRGDIAAFVNNGGGLLGFSSTGFSNPYAYLGGVGSFSFNFPPQYRNINPTSDGLAIGISNALDVCCWHDEYVRFPNFLKVLASNANTGRAAAIGGANVFISSIQLAPATASGPTGTNHTLTASVEENGAPMASRTVTFRVTSGPHSGTTGTGVTNGSGIATFTYRGTRSGTDAIVASYVNSRGSTETSNTVSKAWVNQPPTVNAGPDVTGNEGSAIALDGGAADPEGDPLSYSWSYAPVSGVDAGATCAFANANAPQTTITCTDDGVYRATLTASDGVNPAVGNDAIVTVRNVAPVADFRATSPVDEGSPITLALSNPSDPSSVDTAAGFTYAFDCGEGAGYQAASASPSVVCPTNDNGVRAVKARISDKDGGVSEYTANVTVNNVAPVADFTATSPVDEGSPFTLALSNPSDPSSVDTAAGFTYEFDCDDSTGYQVSPSASVSCPTFDNGIRVVKARISDKDGGATEYTANVTVNNVAPTVGTITAPIDPVAVGTAITVSAPFTDPGTGDTHTAEWDWGNGTTSAGTVTEESGSGSVQDTYTYTTPGIYTLKLTVTDDDGGADQVIFQYVVVYDPDGGFVTGGGWITSPAGACKLSTCTDETSGRASFGFVSKYQKGATVPVGQTEFQFKAGGLNFHSSSYEWLVVAGARAQYKGEGTINQTGEYGFMLSAIDGRINGSDVDKFRIKIWNKATGGVVYDNQMGDADDALASTAIEQGNIVIHKGN